jgi:hypothetical protein
MIDKLGLVFSVISVLSGATLLYDSFLGANKRALRIPRILRSGYLLSKSIALCS